MLQGWPHGFGTGGRDDVWVADFDAWMQKVFAQTTDDVQPYTRESRICDVMNDPAFGDYGRLISSAPIRRLQDKTQVFPLESNDYIRTRLTHSLEVSYIGGSIGQSVEKWLIDKGDMQENQRGYLSSLLRTAGLVHDLGNPPFGHFGEEAIKDFFRHYFEKDKHGLEDIEIADLVNFDGNVQTFRILSRLYFFGDEFSYNLTYTTLSSVIRKLRRRNLVIS